MLDSVGSVRGARGSGGRGPALLARLSGLIVVLLMAAAVLGGCSSAPLRPSPQVSQPEERHELTEDDVSAWLDGKIPDALNRGDLPGAVVTVVHNGRILVTKGYGYAATGADGEPQRLVDSDTLFRIASVSKLATSIAVMQLVERGELDLDVDISAYTDVKIPRRYPGDITLRNLLTHTAGFEERGENLVTSEPGPFDLEKSVRQDPPVQVFAPGTTPAYSNYGISLAGYIVERVSGEVFEDYVREHVLEPAGMDSSTFDQPLPERLAGRMANGYKTTGGRAQPFELIDSPAGGMTTSGTDAGRFMLAMLNQSQGGALLEEGTWKQMFGPGLGADQLGTLAEGKQMGLGFFDESRNGHQIVGHEGGTVFQAELEIYPNDGSGVFVAVNGEGKDGAAALKDDLMRGFSDRYYPGSEPGAEDKPSDDESRQHAQVAAGTYTSSRAPMTSFASIREALPAAWSRVDALDDGHLLLRAGESVVEYEEIKPWVWRQLGGSRTLAVQVEGGRVVRIGDIPAFSLLPITVAQRALVPVVLGATAVLVLLVLAWPVGAVRRLLALRAGDASAGVPLSWWARSARIGAVLILAAIGAWAGAAASLMADRTSVGPLALHGIQVLTLVGLLGIIPGAVESVRVLRARSGVLRIVTALLLPIALAAVAWMALAFNLLNPDVGF
ncbi:serine hydrolase domain-containing protein [Arachnia propionica]|uniref:serine hydrolase domain-containing protein n=1 Tax=Arachnia propionica TaxID=1750 RepID=UPI000F71E2A2|nr:serine hydrolase domain-containing protein [Arachnia propionica]VEJ57295.1 Esterase estB [Arachnia propionica]